MGTIRGQDLTHDASLQRTDAFNTNTAADYALGRANIGSRENIAGMQSDTARRIAALQAASGGSSGIRPNFSAQDFLRDNRAIPSNEENIGYDPETQSYLLDEESGNNPFRSFFD